MKTIKTINLNESLLRKNGEGFLRSLAAVYIENARKGIN